MHVILLCLALCASAQAAPVLQLVNAWSASTPRGGVLLDNSPYSDESNGFLALSGQTVAVKEVTGSPLKEEPESALSTASQYMMSGPSTPMTDNEPESEQDPALMEIFGHVDDILASDVPADDQVSLILDAILHHTESLQQHASYLETEESDVDHAPLHSFLSSPEKMQRIFRTMLERTQDSRQDQALDRIRAILSETDSLHKKIKKILNEIAHDLGLTVDMGWNDGTQVPLIADHD